MRIYCSGCGEEVDENPTTSTLSTKHYCPSCWHIRVAELDLKAANKSFGELKNEGGTSLEDLKTELEIEE